MNADRLLALLRRHRAPIEITAVALVVAALALWTGARASSAAAPFRAESARLREAAATIERWKRDFQPPSDAELVQWAALDVDSLRPAVVSGERLSIAREVARLAEDAGLRGVQVRFVPSEGEAPVRQRFGEHAITLADYALAVEFSGSYPAVLQFVSNLPGAVAVVRVRVDQGGARSRVVLAVYEVPRRHG